MTSGRTESRDIRGPLDVSVASRGLLIGKSVSNQSQMPIKGKPKAEPMV